jgi:hypothetical protein
MKLLPVLGLSLLGVLAASPAFALTITNDDPDPQIVIVTKGGASQTITVAPQQKAQADCEGGCVLKLKDSDDQYDFRGADQVSIQDDVMFIDDDPTAADAADQSDPPLPGAFDSAKTGTSNSNGAGDAGDTDTAKNATSP